MKTLKIGNNNGPSLIGCLLYLIVAPLVLGVGLIAIKQAINMRQMFLKAYRSDKCEVWMDEKPLLQDNVQHDYFHWKFYPILNRDLVIHNQLDDDHSELNKYWFADRNIGWYLPNSSEHLFHRLSSQMSVGNTGVMEIGDFTIMYDNDSARLYYFELTNPYITSFSKSEIAQISASITNYNFNKLRIYYHWDAICIICLIVFVAIFVRIIRIIKNIKHKRIIKRALRYGLQTLVCVNEEEYLKDNNYNSFPMLRDFERSRPPIQPIWEFQNVIVNNNKERYKETLEGNTFTRFFGKLQVEAGYDDEYTLVNEKSHKELIVSKNHLLALIECEYYVINNK